MEFTNWRMHQSNPAKRIDLERIEVYSTLYDIGTLGIELHAADGRIATIQVDEAELAELRRTMRRAYISKAAEARDETAEDYAGRILDIAERLIWRLDALRGWPSASAISRELARLIDDTRADIQIAQLDHTDGPGEAAEAAAHEDPAPAASAQPAPTSAP